MERFKLISKENKRGRSKKLFNMGIAHAFFWERVAINIKKRRNKVFG